MEFWDSPSSLKHTPTNLSTLLTQRKWGKIACAEILPVLIVDKVTLHIYGAFFECSPKSMLKWSMHVNIFIFNNLDQTQYEVTADSERLSCSLLWLLLHLFMLSAGISIVHVNKAWWMMVFNSSSIQFNSVQNTLLSIAIITIKRKCFFTHTSSATLTVS